MELLLMYENAAMLVLGFRAMTELHSGAYNFWVVRWSEKLQCIISKNWTHQWCHHLKLDKMQWMSVSESQISKNKFVSAEQPFSIQNPVFCWMLLTLLPPQWYLYLCWFETLAEAFRLIMYSNTFYHLYLKVCTTQCSSSFMWLQPKI